jgi:hypothetical protein
MYKNCGFHIYCRGVGRSQNYLFPERHSDRTDPILPGILLYCPWHWIRIRGSFFTWPHFGRPAIQMRAGGGAMAAPTGPNKLWHRPKGHFKATDISMETWQRRNDRAFRCLTSFYESPCLVLPAHDGLAPVARQSQTHVVPPPVHRRHLSM